MNGYRQQYSSYSSPSTPQESSTDYSSRYGSRNGRSGPYENDRREPNNWKHAQQNRNKDMKSQRETDYFWSQQNYNRQPYAQSEREIQREREELFNNGPVQSAGIDFSSYDDIPVEKKGNGLERIPVINSFGDINSLCHLQRFLADNVSLCRYNTPTPVQKNAIPAAICGRDLMVCAQTGSGKTCAFLFPIIASLDISKAIGSLNGPYKGPACPRAVVMAPTRELCSQIHKEARKLVHAGPFRALEIYGGMDAKTQIYELARGCDILTATPGRLTDFIDRGVVSMASVEFLVLDEADRMLDMGFEPQIRKIVEQRDMPPSRPREEGGKKRQTLLFSATFAKEIQKLARDFLNDFIWIAVGRVGGAADSVTQRIVPTDPRSKPDELKKLITNGNPSDLTLVFCARKKTASWLCQILKYERISATQIHGDLNQSEREYALKSFKDKRATVLVATDVAARGLDIPSVAHVINYDLPNGIDDYVHRIGRTGRIGNRGLATSFFVCGANADRDGSDAGLARDMIEVLENSKNEVPDFLRYERGKPKSSKGGKGKGKGFSSYGRSFGGASYGTRF